MDSVELSNSDEIIVGTTSPVAPSSPQPHSTASSSPSKTTSPSKVGVSRRKSTHQRIIIDNDIEFESVPISESVPSTDPSPAVFPSSDFSEPPAKRLQLGEDWTDNPNSKLMRNVAFLRASVNYLMLSLGKTPFDFSNAQPLTQMWKQYSQGQEVQVQTVHPSGKTG